MSQNAFFFFFSFFLSLQNSRSSGKPKNDTKTLLFHPPSPFQVIFATATVVAFVLLRNSRFNFHCYTQREATPTQKSAWKWRYDLSRRLERKITKGIHSRKPASLNHPIDISVLKMHEVDRAEHLDKERTFSYASIVYCNYASIVCTREMMFFFFI